MATASSPSAMLWVALALSSLGAGSAQQIGDLVKEEAPEMPLAMCSVAGGCTSEKAYATLDANWRWMHHVGSYGNCYTAGSWDQTLCSDPTTCAAKCALEGVDKKGYKNTYGISTVP